MGLLSLTPPVYIYISTKTSSEQPLLDFFRCRLTSNVVMKIEDLKVTLILRLITSCCIRLMKIHHGILHFVLDSRYDTVSVRRSFHYVSFWCAERKHDICTRAGTMLICAPGFQKMCNCVEVYFFYHNLNQGHGIVCQYKF